MGKVSVLILLAPITQITADVADMLRQRGVEIMSSTQADLDDTTLGKAEKAVNTPKKLPARGGGYTPPLQPGDFGYTKVNTLFGGTNLDMAGAGKPAQGRQTRNATRRLWVR